MKTLEYTAGAEDTGRRIDAALAAAFPELTRSFAQQLLAEGRVLCNGRSVAKSARLTQGDALCVSLPDAQPVEIIPQDIPLDIVYEDSSLLVVNKPKGMVVHPAAGNPDGTLVNALLYHCAGRLSGINGEVRPGIVHRIDKDTSGLLVVAKDNETHLSLSQQFAVPGYTILWYTAVLLRTTDLWRGTSVVILWIESVWPSCQRAAKPLIQPTMWRSAFPPLHIFP